MYIAKRDGKGGYRLFEPAMHEGVLARLELRADLQRAIAGDQLELYYQPVVRLEDGTVSGVEALLRGTRWMRQAPRDDGLNPIVLGSGYLAVARYPVHRTSFSGRRCGGCGRPTCAGPRGWPPAAPGRLGWERLP